MSNPYRPPNEYRCPVCDSKKCEPIGFIEGFLMVVVLLCFAFLAVIGTFTCIGFLVESGIIKF